GAGEPGDEPVFGAGVGLACRPAAAGAAGVGGVAVDGGGGAVVGAGCCVLGGAEHLGDIGGVVAEDVAEDERGALAWGQQLQGGDEGQGDGLGGLVAGLRYAAL